jgi:hypothetical protein
MKIVGTGVAVGASARGVGVAGTGVGGIGVTVGTVVGVEAEVGTAVRVGGTGVAVLSGGVGVAEMLVVTVDTGLGIVSSGIKVCTSLGMQAAQLRTSVIHRRMGKLGISVNLGIENQILLFSLRLGFKR